MAKSKNRNDNTSPEKESPWHHVLALVIVFTSLALISGITVLIFNLSTDKDKAAQTVTSAILPLLGAWVGTVVAFYFSGKNLETATNSVRSLYKQMTSQEKLQSILVKEKMTLKYEMFFKKLPEAGINLVAALNELEKANKGQRIPVLDEKDHPRYMIHRSSVDKYLADSARAGKTSQQLNDLTLADLIQENVGLKRLFETTFVTVSDRATLADAKAAMDKTKDCQDVFVTKNGTRDEEVVGWITNVTIAENSEV